MYLKLPEQTNQNALALLIKAIHPNASYEVVNQTIKELQNLKPVEDKTKELADLNSQAEIDKKEIEELTKQLAKLKGQ